MYIYLKPIILLFFIYNLSSLAFSQTTQQIDSLLLKTYFQNHIEGDFKGAIETAYQAIELSRNINYEYGLYYGNYTIAVILADCSDYEKSIEFIEKAKQYKNYLQNNPEGNFNLLLLEANNNYDLGFTILSKDLYKQITKLVLTISDFNKQSYYFIILYKQAFLSFDNEDSTYYYHTKANQLVENAYLTFPDSFPRQELMIKDAEIKQKLGNFHLSNANFDSARYYFDKALNIGIELKSSYVQAIAYARLGELYEKEGKNDLALAKFNDAESILKNHSIFSILKIIYEAKTRIFRITGDKTNEIIYERLNNDILDSLKKEEEKGRNKTILNLIAKKEKEINRVRGKGYTIVYSVLLFGLFAVLIAILVLHIYRQKKNNQINVQKKRLKIKSDIIVKQAQETEILKEKINDSFQEVIDLAKDNHPNFYIRFQEVYPEFHQKLAETLPDIKSTELQLCAYVFLGFTNKEISQYLFKSLRTIESRITNLRKRFSVPPSETLGQFLLRLL